MKCPGDSASTWLRDTSKAGSLQPGLDRDAAAGADQCLLDFSAREEELLLPCATLRTQIVEHDHCIVSCPIVPAVVAVGCASPLAPGAAPPPPCCAPACTAFDIIWISCGVSTACTTAAAASKSAWGGTC